MSFEEYLVKFEQMFKFSTYLKLHVHEKWKATHLQVGLNMELKIHLVLLVIESYSLLVTKYRLVSERLEDLKMQKAFFQKKKTVANLEPPG